MSLLGRTCRSLSSVVTVVLLGVCLTGVLVDVAGAGDAVPETAERRGSSQRSGHHDRRQQASDCGAVRQFARQTMHYGNALPATKSHGTFSGDAQENSRPSGFCPSLETSVPKV